MPRLTTLVAALATALGSASAQSAFSTDEAARCGVVFANMAEALSGNADAPDDLVRQVAIALPIWDYELIASAPGDEAALRAAVDRAMREMETAMPTGEGEGMALERGDFLIDRARACGTMIDDAYPDANHPVLAELRERAEAGDGPVPVPSQKPDTRDRRLR